MKYIRFTLNAIQKDFIIFIRDLGALLTLFLMPAILLICVTSIQVSNYEKSGSGPTELLIINQDSGKQAQNIYELLQQSTNFKNNFKLRIYSHTLSEQSIDSLINSENFTLIILFKPNFTLSFSQLNQQILNNILHQPNKLPKIKIDKQIAIYLNSKYPSMIKENIKLQLNNLFLELKLKQIESIITQDNSNENVHLKQFSELKIQESSSTIKNHYTELNLIQLNVIAWVVFAIFFIMNPFSINIIKEKLLGTYNRIKILPVPEYLFILAKTVLFIIICLGQYSFMILISVYIFPVVGLEPFSISLITFFTSLILIFFCGIAALGIGLILTCFCKTIEQIAPLSAFMVIILACLGGIFIPEFLLSKKLIPFLHLSPLNWSVKLLGNFFNEGKLTMKSILICLELAFIYIIGLVLNYFQEKRQYM